MGIERTIIQGTCDGCGKPFSVEAGSSEAMTMKRAEAKGKACYFHNEECEIKWMATPEIIPVKKVSVPKVIPKKKSR